LVRNVTTLDKEHFGRSAGVGSFKLFLDVVETLGIEPVAPGQNIEDQGSNIGELKHCSHKSISIRGWGAMPLENDRDKPYWTADEEERGGAFTFGLALELLAGGRAPLLAPRALVRGALSAPALAIDGASWSG